MAGVFLPIHDAAETGEPEDIARLLADDPALVHAFDWRGATPLHIAAAYNAAEVVEALLAAGADPNARMAGDGATPLHVVGSPDEAEKAWSLLAAGADPNASDNNGRTPLHIAGPEVTRLLLGAGAAVDARDSEGRTALHVTAGRAGGRLPLLLDAGADPHTRDARGRTPLHYAAERGALLDVGTLLHRGADRTLTDQEAAFSPTHQVGLCAFCDRGFSRPHGPPFLQTVQRPQTGRSFLPRRMV